MPDAVVIASEYGIENSMSNPSEITLRMGVRLFPVDGSPAEVGVITVTQPLTASTSEWRDAFRTAIESWAAAPPASPNSYTIVRMLTSGFISGTPADGGGGEVGEAFPVGSVFTSVVSTNPGTLLGYGTWVAFATGRTLVGLDSGDADFDTAEEVGGAKTHTLTEAEMPSHTHGVTDPGHTHDQAWVSSTNGVRDFSGSSDSDGVQATSTATTGISIDSTGGGQAHNNMPPFVIVYFWKRTA